VNRRLPAHRSRERKKWIRSGSTPIAHPVDAASADVLSSARSSEREASQGSLTSASIRSFALDLALARDLDVRAAAEGAGARRNGSGRGRRRGKRRRRRRHLWTRAAVRGGRWSGGHHRGRGRSVYAGAGRECGSDEKVGKCETSDGNLTIERGATD
jgi:hypothetical protein